MGTRGHEMSERERAKRNRPKEFRYVVNIRHLQNGIGIAGVLGIVLIFVYLALDPGSPSDPPAMTSGPTAPFTSTGGNGLPSGMPSAPLPTHAPSSVSASSSSGSPSSLRRTNNRAVSSAPGSRSTPIDPVASSTSAPPSATTQPRVATTSNTTTSNPPLTTKTTPTTTTRHRQRARRHQRRRPLPERSRAPQ